MAPVYFVNYYLHNKDNDGWAFKVVGKYNTETAAEAAYCDELGSKIDNPVYDVGVVSVTDSLNHNIVARSWDRSVEPNNE